MNQNQINELLLEALVTTEIDVTSGICQCKHKVFELATKYNVVNSIVSFETLLLSTCKNLKVYSGNWAFPIKGGPKAYYEYVGNLWDMDTEYGQWRNRVYDQMVFTLQDKLGIAT